MRIDYLSTGDGRARAQQNRLSITARVRGDIQMIRQRKNAASISYGLLAYKLLGPKIFLEKVKYQLYSRIPYLCLSKELGKISASQAARDKINLLPASADDVDQFFRLMAKESPASRYEFLVRKKFYEKGFHDCYIGITAGSHEMCSIVWHVTAKDIVKTQSEHLFSMPQTDELYGENIYTLEKFRGKGIMNATGYQQEEIAYKQGYKRMYFYIRADNAPSLKSCKKQGRLVFQTLMYCHFFFNTYRKIIDRFDPPTPMEKLKLEVI